MKNAVSVIYFEPGNAKGAGVCGSPLTQGALRLELGQESVPGACATLQSSISLPPRLSGPSSRAKSSRIP